MLRKRMCHLARMVLLATFALVVIGRADLVRADEAPQPSSVLRRLLEGTISQFRMTSVWGSGSEPHVTLLKKIEDEQQWEHYMRVKLIHGTPLRALTTSWNGFVAVHEIDSGLRHWRRQVAEGVVSDAVVLPGELQVLVATPTGDTLLLDLADGHTVRTYPAAQNARITALAIAPTGDVFATGDVAGNIRVIAITTGETVATLPPHFWPILTVSFSLTDGLLYAADTTTIATYNWRQAVQLRAYPPVGTSDKFWFTSATFSQHEERVVVGSYDTCSSINLVTGETEREYPGTGAGVVRVQFLSDDTKLMTIGRDGKLRIFDVETAVIDGDFNVASSWVPAISDVAIDLATQRFALTTYEVQFFRMESKPMLRTYRYRL